MQNFRVKKPSCKILKTKNCVPFEVQYTSKSKSDAIHGRASELQDAYVLANITDENYDQKNLAASKYRYHRVCMDGFLKMKGSDIKDTSTSYNQAFLQIVSEINDHFCRLPLSKLWIEKKE